ncbi:MAG: PRC-barrel domain-containing protein [Thermoleophilia bacterium]
MGTRYQMQYDQTIIGPETYSEQTRLPRYEDLEGMQVRDANGDKVGKVDDIYADEQGGYARYLAVKTGWFGSKRHMIPVDDVRLEGDGDDHWLVVPYDKDHLREGPTFDRDDDFTREHETSTYGHYGRTGYWDAIRARQTTPAPTPEIAEAEADDAIRRGDDPRRVAVKRWGA